MNAKSGNRKSRLVKLIKIIVAIYILVGAVIYFFQDKFLFHPQLLPADYAFHFDMPFKEINVKYDHLTSFNIIHFTSQNNLLRKGAVIYCHGNMENVNHYAMLVKDFTQYGYEVWMMDYPTFGKSTGVLNENMLYTETLEVYKMVRAAHYTRDNIIVYGKSLGTGIAAQLASVRDCKRLILESPYYSMANLVSHYCWMYPVDWILHFKIPTYQYLRKFSAHISIFHGTNDNVIPFSNAEKLKEEVFKPGDELIPVEGGHHKDLSEFLVVKNKLDSLLAL